MRVGANGAAGTLAKLDLLEKRKPPQMPEAVAALCPSAQVALETGECQTHLSSY